MTRRVALTLILACQMACLGRGFAGDEIELEGAGKRLSLDEVSGYDGKPSASPFKQSKKKLSSKTPQAPTPNQSPAILQPIAATPWSSPALRASCEALLRQNLPGLQRLLSLLDPTTQSTLDPGVIHAVTKLSPHDCLRDESRTHTVTALESFLDQSHPRVGMILPLTGSRSKLANLLVEGMRAELADNHLKFDDLIVLKDSAGLGANTERAFAELVLKDRVRLVIGGLEAEEAAMLVKNSQETAIPTLLLSREREIITPSNYAFRVYPDEQRLAETLAAGAKKRNLNRIAILKPASGKSNAIAKYFTKAVKDQGGQIPFEIIYTPGNFDSMSAAARQLFRTDVSLRRDEYKEAYKDARKRAQQEGVPFDPRMVLLKPLIDFDAVFLPDDFRTARHFAKLFKFHMVDKIVLIGNHEWRSPGLIQPFDEMFSDAMFADFIGSYATLPPSIAAPTLGSPYFVHPQAVVPTDFRLIGYRIANVATQIVRLNTARRFLPSEMLELVTNTTGNSKVFAADRNVLWPTYLFNVQRSGIRLETDPPAYQSLPSAERPKSLPTISSGWTPSATNR